MAGERFKMAMMLIVCFFLLAAASLGLVACGKTDVAALTQLYQSLGTLAAIFGIGPIITAWVVIKGTTSASASMQNQNQETNSNPEKAKGDA